MSPKHEELAVGRTPTFTRSEAPASLRRSRRWGIVRSLLVAVILLTACGRAVAGNMDGAAGSASAVGSRIAVPTSSTVSPPEIAMTPTIQRPTVVAPIPSAAGTAPVALSPSPASSVPAGRAGIPSFSHIFLIVLENASYEDVFHSPAMPYLNQLGATYTIAEHYYAITHPSLPNYLALLGGNTFGITSDCVTCTVAGPNLVDQLEAAGKSWTAYMEGMPGVCPALPVWPAGRYAKKHDPFLYFDDIRANPKRCAHVVLYSSLAHDLTTGRVPDFAWITPDSCHDGHDCPLAQTDTWLASALPPILSSPAFQQGGALFITFDEGRASSTAGCCRYAAGGQVFTLVASPLAKRHAQVAVPYDHYALLRTIEDAWKLPHLARAADTATTNMAACFQP